MNYLALETEYLPKLAESLYNLFICMASSEGVNLGITKEFSELSDNEKKLIMSFFGYVMSMQLEAIKKIVEQKSLESTKDTVQGLTNQEAVVMCGSFMKPIVVDR